jgi:universal stress protein E
MSNTKTILVVIDPSADSQPALEKSARFARALGASLEILTCDYDQHLAGGRSLTAQTVQDARESLLEMHRRHLEALAAPLRAGGLEVRLHVTWEHPLDRCVLRKVGELEPLLVAKDTLYRDHVRRASFANTDWNLIRRCPVPLLLVKAHELAAIPRIVAAVDPLHAFDKPADLDHAILALATELTVALQGRLEVFHAYDTAPAIAAAVGGITPIAAPVRELAEATEATHRAALSRLLEGYSIASDAVHLRQGVAAEQLLTISRAIPADVVVMGAVSRSSIKRVLIGNTAERVLDRLPCDLLIVKPAGFAGAAS